MNLEDRQWYVDELLEVRRQLDRLEQPAISARLFLEHEDIMTSLGKYITLAKEG